MYRTTFTYSAANRLLTETNSLQVVTRYTYDAAGNRLTNVDGNGKTTHYVYDANRRLERVEFFDGTAYEYDYDERGLRTLERNPTHERRFEHDALGRVQRTIDVTLGKTLEAEYDATGNRTLLRFDGLETRYGYDPLGRLTRVTAPDGRTTQLGYDADGARARLVLGNGAVATYAYDTTRRLTSIVWANAQGAPLQSFGYTLDRVGNRLAKAFLDGSREAYTYDGLDRLINVVYPGGRSVSYELGDLGNRYWTLETNGQSTVQTRYQYNAFNQVTALQDATTGALSSFTYDGNGNLRTEVASGATTTHTYDADNRLRRLDLPGGVSNTFEYDANGLRVKKIEASGMKRYLLDGASIVAEYDASGARTAVYVNNPQRIDEVFSAAVVMNGRQETLYPMTDALGSIYGLGDAAGAQVSTFGYDVYGKRTQASGSLALGFGYTGREHEAGGLNYNRDRYLAVARGAWTQADRLGMAAGVNFYGYAYEQPVRYVDPSGQYIYVFFWGPRAEQTPPQFGHAAIGASDGNGGINVFGLFPDPRYLLQAAKKPVPSLGELVSSVPETEADVLAYQSREGRPPDAVVKIHSSAEDDRLVTAKARFLQSSSYSLRSNNCADFVAETMRPLHFDVSSIHEVVKTHGEMLDVATPRKLFRVLTVSSYKRGGLSPILTFEVLKEPHGKLGRLLPYEIE